MEKENRTEDNGKNKIVLLILGVATVLVALIGATFAYFTSVINKVNGNQSVVLTTQTVQGVTYTASDPLSLVNVIPGASKETTFTIANPNASASAKYSLDFVPDADDFSIEEGTGQLLVTISGGQVTGSKVFDFTDGANATRQSIVSGVTIGAGTSDVYTVKVEFVETQSVQDTNQTKSFAGHIEVTQSIVTEGGE